MWLAANLPLRLVLIFNTCVPLALDVRFWPKAGLVPRMAAIGRRRMLGAPRFTGPGRTVLARRHTCLAPGSLMSRTVEACHTVWSEHQPLRWCCVSASTMPPRSAQHVRCLSLAMIDAESEVDSVQAAHLI